MSLACCYVPFSTLVTHVSTHIIHHASIRTGDTPGPTAADWTTAISTAVLAFATIVLAAFAIVTAYYARKAFREQSKEVKDQAAMLEVQSRRLADQRKINKLQARELRASIAERARQRRIAEREQADAVLFEWWPSSHVLILGTSGSPIGTSPSAVLAVDNESRRRILDVTCRLEPSEGAGFALAAERTGTLTEGKTSAHRAMMINPAEGRTVPLARPGTRFGFLIGFDLDAHPDVRLAVRFTDDAGLHWQIDQDLHLEPLNNRDDW